MLISVLITTWGCDAYLPACRLSVASARLNCPLDVEVIELSDGSGVWNARNELIRRAHGEWLCFVDGDDRLEPDSLGRLARVIADDELVDLVTFRLVEEREWDGGVSRPVRPFPKNWQACAFRREVLPPMGFSPYVFGEDALFLLKCFRRAQKVVDVDFVFYRYCRHHGSATMKGDYSRLFEARTGYVRDWFAELSLFSPDMLARLRDLGEARRKVIRDLLGSAALDLMKIKPPPWGSWFMALDQVAEFSKLLPLYHRLVLFGCRFFRWRWVTLLVCNFVYRLRLKLFGDRI